jgi:hypothetical protein
VAPALGGAAFAVREEGNAIAARTLAMAEDVQLVAIQVAKVTGVETFAACADRAFILAAEFERPGMNAIDLLVRVDHQGPTITPLPTVAALPSKGVMTARLGLSGATPQATPRGNSHTRLAPVSASKAS